MLSEKTISLVLALDDNEFSARMGKAKERLEQLESVSNSTGRSFSISGGILSAFGGVVSGLAVETVARELVEAGMAAERMRNAMTAATGSLTQGSVEMAFVRSEAQRLGLDLERAAYDYTRLTAAAQGTSLQGEQTRLIFSAVAEASVALGLSADETSGALTAIQQMISKGTVSAEELRGQLGERLPGAFNVAARAMGVTTAELGKMLQQGKVVSSDFLPRFADELPRAFKASADALNSSQAAVNRLNTALFELKVEVMDNGGKDVFIALTAGATSLVESLRDVNREYGSFDKVIEAQTGKLTRFAAAYLIFQKRVLSGEFSKIPDDWRNFFALEKEARANAVNNNPPIGSEEIAADKRGNGRLNDHIGGSSSKDKRRPSWATPATNKTFFSQVWDKAADELAYDEAQAFILKVNDLGTGFKMGQPTVSLLGSFDLLSPYGRTEMTPAEQSQFDAAASQAEWETRQAESRQRELQAEQQFYAEKAMLQGDSTQMELLRIQEEENRWLESWAMQATTFEEYQNRLVAIKQQTSAKTMAIENQERMRGLTSTMQYTEGTAAMFSNLYSASSGKLKVFFRMAQVANAAGAIMSGFRAGMAAVEPPPVGLGPVAGLPLKGLMIAGGFAAAASIMAQSSGGGGGGGVPSESAYGGGTPTSPIITQPVSSSAPTSTAPAAAPVSITQVFQISTGVSDTVRSEVMGMMPAIEQRTVSAVHAAIESGGPLAKAVGRT